MDPAPSNISRGSTSPSPTIQVPKFTFSTGSPNFDIPSFSTSLHPSITYNASTSYRFDWNSAKQAPLQHTSVTRTAAPLQFFNVDITPTSSPINSKNLEQTSNNILNGFCESIPKPAEIQSGKFSIKLPNQPSNFSLSPTLSTYTPTAPIIPQRLQSSYVPTSSFDIQPMLHSVLATPSASSPNTQTSFPLLLPNPIETGDCIQSPLSNSVQDAAFSRTIEPLGGTREFPLLDDDLHVSADGSIDTTRASLLQGEQQRGVVSCTPKQFHPSPVTGSSTSNTTAEPATPSTRAPKFSKMERPTSNFLSKLAQSSTPHIQQLINSARAPGSDSVAVTTQSDDPVRNSDTLSLLDSCPLQVSPANVIERNDPVADERSELVAMPQSEIADAAYLEHNTLMQTLCDLEDLHDTEQPSTTTDSVLTEVFETVNQLIELTESNVSNRVVESIPISSSAGGPDEIVEPDDNEGHPLEFLPLVPVNTVAPCCRSNSPIPELDAPQNFYNLVKRVFYAFHSLHSTLLTPSYFRTEMSLRFAANDSKQSRIITYPQSSVTVEDMDLSEAYSATCGGETAMASDPPSTINNRLVMPLPNFSASTINWKAATLPTIGFPQSPCDGDLDCSNSESVTLEQPLNSSFMSSICDSDLDEKSLPASHSTELLMGQISAWSTNTNNCPVGIAFLLALAMARRSAPEAKSSQLTQCRSSTPVRPSNQANTKKRKAILHPTLLHPNISKRPKIDKP